MYGGTMAFPVPQVLTGTGIQDAHYMGLTVEQYTMIHIAAAMAGNQWYQGYTATALAERAREIALAVLTVTP